MIANEVTMVRNLSPRLLHKGNYGFTTEEMMDAMAEIAPAAVKRAKATSRSNQLDAHASRQLEMEGQAISDPAMFPLVGRHGSTSDTPIVEPGIASMSASSGQPAPAAEPEGVTYGASSSAEELEPSLRHYHWSNFECEEPSNSALAKVRVVHPSRGDRA